jgi:hypothetical protein
MRYLLACVSGILLGSTAIASVTPPADPVGLSSDLTLEPSWKSESQQTPDQEDAPPVQLDENDLRNTSLLSSIRLPRRENGKGLDTSSVFDNHTAVEYRTGLGFGLGVATNASWCLSQNFPLAQGLQLSIYYLRGLGAFTPPLDRSTAAEIDLTGDRSVGMSLQWKF